MQITLGLPEPRAFSSLPRLKLVQAGVQRTHAERKSQPPRIRLPITPTVLQKMHQEWNATASDPDTIMLWAASLMCFYGFFRSGEITVPTATAFDAQRHLSWGDVTVDNNHDPKVVRVVLKYSKTDQLRKGAEIFIGKTDNIVCPIAAVVAYMVVRGNQPGPFFKFKDGQPLTKASFVRHVRLALQKAGLPYNEFAGHSFRIGAATTAAKAGIEDSQIRTLGRWSSAAFLSYIRTPRETLAGISQVLANS